MSSIMPALLLIGFLTLPFNLAMPLSHPTPNAADTEVIAPGQAAWETVASPYPPEVRKALKKVRKSGGYTVVRANGKSYVVIGAGKRPTGGYRLVAEQVRKTGAHQYRLQVRVKAPAPGAFNTQAISYPTLVVSLPDQRAKVRVNIR